MRARNVTLGADLAHRLGRVLRLKRGDRVLLSEGAEVRANQGILVMEAMKMQNEIKSPKAGIIKRLGAKAGAAVNSGDLLAIVE